MASIKPSQFSGLISPINARGSMFSLGDTFASTRVWALRWFLSLLSLHLRLGIGSVPGLFQRSSMAKALAYALPSPGLAECFQHLLPSGAKRSKSDQPQQVQRCGARLHRAGYQRFTTSFRCAGGFAPVAAVFWGSADADPGLAHVLRRSVGALRPGDGMAAATLMIHGSERDFASSLVLAADLMVQRTWLAYSFAEDFGKAFQQEDDLLCRACVCSEVGSFCTCASQ